MRTENKRKTMVQKKENGVLSVPSETVTDGWDSA